MTWRKTGKKIELDSVQNFKTNFIIGFQMQWKWKLRFVNNINEKDNTFYIINVESLDCSIANVLVSDAMTTQSC